MNTSIKGKFAHAQLLISLALIGAVGCGDMDSVSVGELQEENVDMAPITGVINQPIRHGSLDGDGHPGILRLHIRVGNSGFLCSGTVIEQRTILTAAHCVDNAAAASDVYVVLESGYRQASAMVIHENYSADAPHIRRVGSNFYRFSGPDIALLSFAEDLPAPVVAISQDTPAAGELLTIVGYGNDENMENSVRRVGQVEFVAMTETYLVDQNTVDADTGALVVNPGPNNDTVCGGDSGGAMLRGDALIGVTSGGVVATGDDNPCVRSRNANFISPAAYLDWIENHVDLPTNNDVVISDELRCSARLLDDAQGFVTPDNYSHNWGGRGEKWFSNGQGQWHFILPTGAIHQWSIGSNPPAGDQVGALSPEFHTDPTQLTEAPEAPADCEAPAVDEATLRADAYALDQQYDFRFNGSYATNWGGQGEKWVSGGANNWFYILPNGQLIRWSTGSRPLTGDVIGQLDATFHADPTKLHDAEDPNAEANCVDNSVEAQAYRLDQENGFRFTGSFAEGWGGNNEKWFQNANGRWFFITDTGSVYKWTVNSRPAEGTLFGTLNADYHADPMLLLEATQPSEDNCNGDAEPSELETLDSTYGFTGTGDYNDNWGGLEEKWFTNRSNNWFYVVPNGNVYRWTLGTRLEGTLIAELDSTVYANPALLHDAASE
jgi:V8-like Glu-specific endopeptidase